MSGYESVFLCARVPQHRWLIGRRVEWAGSLSCWWRRKVWVRGPLVKQGHSHLHTKWQKQQQRCWRPYLWAIMGPNQRQTAYREETPSQLPSSLNSSSASLKERPVKCLTLREEFWPLYGLVKKKTKKTKTIALVIYGACHSFIVNSFG